MDAKKEEKDGLDLDCCGLLRAGSKVSVPGAPVAKMADSTHSTDSSL